MVGKFYNSDYARLVLDPRSLQDIQASEWYAAKGERSGGTIFDANSVKMK
jgi:hypothetical protein